MVVFWLYGPLCWVGLWGVYRKVAKVAKGRKEEGGADGALTLVGEFGFSWGLGKVDRKAAKGQKSRLDDWAAGLRRWLARPASRQISFGRDAQTTVWGQRPQPLGADFS
jgi:hypothetical protein